MASLQSLKEYGNVFQTKVLAALLTNKEFLVNVRDLLRIENFDNPAHQWIIEKIIQIWDTYRIPAPMEDLKVELKKVENDPLQESIKIQLKEAYKFSDNNLEYVMEEFLDFCKNQEIKSALINSVDLLKQGDYDSIRYLMDKALKAGYDRNIGHQYADDVENRYRENPRIAVPTPWEVINELTQGGFGPGDLVLVFGNPGGGKCVHHRTKIDIQYEEIGLHLKNSVGQYYILWIGPWSLYTIENQAIHGWQLQNYFTECGTPFSKRVIAEKIRVGHLFWRLGIKDVAKQHYTVDFKLNVKTPYGYKRVLTLFTTHWQRSIKVRYRIDGKKVMIQTALNHLFKMEDLTWKKAIDLQVGDRIISEKSHVTVYDLQLIETQDVLYDMTVDEVECYYSNGVVSHNSWMMVDIAGYAIKSGYNVIYYTLELSEGYIGKRVDCYLTGLDITELDKRKAFVQSTLSEIEGKLVIKEYNPKQATVTTLKSHIQKCIDTGIKPDMIIIDYIDYLKAPNKKNFDKKDIIDDLYIACKGLAKELKIPIISPSQVNRAGAKDDVIEGDKAAGSYDKMMVSDIALSLSRKKEDKKRGTGRIHVMKNRYGRDGTVHPCTVNTQNGLIEIQSEIDEEDIIPISNKPKAPDLITNKGKLELLAKLYEVNEIESNPPEEPKNLSDNLDS